MAKGYENLTPFSERSEEERRESGRKGGKKSGEARRRKKALRVALKEAVSLPLKALRAAIMAAVGISDDSLTVGEAVIGGIIISACGGSAPMVKVLLDTLGESADIRIKERELKQKEQGVNAVCGAPPSIVFTWSRDAGE